jgi:hypothetical protein
MGYFGWHLICAMITAILLLSTVTKSEKLEQQNIKII